MSGVVLRCRTCGTTQDQPGECDVCGSGPVAYFCGNHRPGRWLDGPACGACGARFGEAPVKPAPPPSPGRSLPRSSTRPTRSDPSDAASTMTPAARRVRRPAAPPPPGRISDAPAEPDRPSLADVLFELAEEGRRVRPPAAETAPATPRAPALGFPIAGCLFRLLLLLLVLGVLAVMAGVVLVTGSI